MSPPNDLQALQERYLREAVTTAPPATRLTMLFDKLALDIVQGIAAIEERDYKKSDDALLNAQDIVLALRHTLRVDLWEGAPALGGLYEHLYGELVGANMAKDTGRLHACAKIVDQLATAWRQAAETVLNAKEDAGPEQEQRDVG